MRTTQWIATALCATTRSWNAWVSLKLFCRNQKWVMNASSPSVPPSDPKPLSFTPPNGVSGMASAKWFRPSMPASISLEIFSATWRLSVKAYDASPTGSRLASASASSMESPPLQALKGRTAQVPFASVRSAARLGLSGSDRLPDVATEHAALKHRRLGIGGEEDNVGICQRLDGL